MATNPLDNYSNLKNDPFDVSQANNVLILTLLSCKNFWIFCAEVAKSIDLKASKAVEGTTI